MCDVNLHKVLYSRDAIKVSSVSVVRSPKLAAIGVATLSGLILHLRDPSTTTTIIEPANGVSKDR
jgi:hypothetical protein